MSLKDQLIILDISFNRLFLNPFIENKEVFTDRVPFRLILKSPVL